MKITSFVICLFFTFQATATTPGPFIDKPIVTGQFATPYFQFLRGHKQGKGQSLQWNMNTNAGIESFEVQYTYEDPMDSYSNWYTAGRVNNSNQNIFKYTDQGALPGIINYRVIASMSNNSGTIVSQVYTCVISQ